MLTSFVTFYFVSMVVLGLVSCAFDVLVYGCDVLIVGGWWWFGCRGLLFVCLGLGFDAFRLVGFDVGGWWCCGTVGFSGCLWFG